MKRQSKDGEAKFLRCDSTQRFASALHLQVISGKFSYRYYVIIKKTKIAYRRNCLLVDIHIALGFPSDCM